jgi:hypothetical protein
MYANITTIIIIIIIKLFVCLLFLLLLLSFVTGLLFLVLLLNQRLSPPLRLQLSDCSTVCIMCDIPSIVVSCSESMECFPGMASQLFLRTLVTIMVTP